MVPGVAPAVPAILTDSATPTASAIPKRALRQICNAAQAEHRTPAIPPPTVLPPVLIEKRSTPPSYDDNYGHYESGDPMPTFSSADAMLLESNYEEATDEYMAACLALPLFFDPMGLEFSCGYLRDQLVRKDRRTSDFAGNSKQAIDLRTKLRLRLIAFQYTHPKLAVQLTLQRFNDPIVTDD